MLLKGSQICCSIIVAKIPFYPYICKMKKTLDILFEDQWLVAIDKPSGLMSVAGNRQGVETAYSLVNDYIAHKYNGRKRAHVMHRLDRDTSGVLLFAKDFQTKRAMTDNWNGNIRERRYVAVLDGVPAEYEITGTNGTRVKRSWYFNGIDSQIELEFPQPVTSVEVHASVTELHEE